VGHQNIVNVVCLHRILQLWFIHLKRVPIDQFKAPDTNFGIKVSEFKKVLYVVMKLLAFSLWSVMQELNSKRWVSNPHCRYTYNEEYVTLESCSNIKFPLNGLASPCLVYIKSNHLLPIKTSSGSYEVVIILIRLGLILKILFCRWLK
jgi:hypothetical protein